MILSLYSTFVKFFVISIVATLLPQRSFEGLNTYRDREITELTLRGIRTLMLKYSYTFIIGG